MGELLETNDEFKLGQNVFCNINVQNIMPGDYPEVLARITSKNTKKTPPKKTLIFWGTNRIYGPIVNIAGDLITVVFNGKNIQLQSIYWSNLLPNKDRA